MHTRLGAGKFNASQVVLRCFSGQADATQRGIEGDRLFPVVDVLHSLAIEHNEEFILNFDPGLFWPFEVPEFGTPDNFTRFGPEKRPGSEFVQQDRSMLDISRDRFDLYDIFEFIHATDFGLDRFQVFFRERLFFHLVGTGHLQVNAFQSAGGKFDAAVIKTFER